MGFILRRDLRDGAPRYDARWRDGTGKQHVKTFNRKRDAQRFLSETEVAVHSGAFVKTQPKRMGAIFDEWRDDLDTRVNLGEVRASTAATYCCNLRVHIQPPIAAYRSDRLSARVMARWRSGLPNKVASGRMSPKSFNNVLTLARQICKWAQHPARAYLTHDPLAGQKQLKLRHREARYLEDDEIAALLAVVADDPEANALVHVMLFGGLRRGEAFALGWEDVESDNGQLRVRRSLYNGNLADTKSVKSERTVDVPRAVINALSRHGEANPVMEGGFVFRTWTGTPLDPSSWYRRRWSDIRRRCNLPDGVGFHTLRHTFAALLLRQGEGLKYTSEQLGHASVQITGDRYGHVLNAQREQAMRRLDDTIRAAKVRKLRVVGGTNAHV